MIALPSWSGTSADWRARLESVETHAFVARSRDDVRDLNVALAPGFYVSAMNDHGQRILTEGPFVHHAEALCAVWPVSRAWSDVDPRSCWYAWGTAQVHGEKR